MSKYIKLTHEYYKSDYQIVFIPKCRFRVLVGMVKSLVEYDLQVISTWKDVIIQEMNVQKDHIHLVCSIPPKVSISEFMGVLKGKKTKTALGQSLLVSWVFSKYDRFGRGYDKVICEISRTS